MYLEARCGVNGVTAVPTGRGRGAPLRRADPWWADRLVAASGGAQLIEMSRDLYGELCDRVDPSEILATVACPGLAVIGTDSKAEAALPEHAAVDCAASIVMYEVARRSGPPST